MTVEIDHIALAVSSLDHALPLYRDLLGLSHKHTEVVEEQKVRAALLQAGQSRIEFVEPLSEDSPVAKYLQRHGEGLHHIAFRVNGLEKLLEKLKKAGVRLIDEKPRAGVEGSRIAFLHPAAASGVLVELVERA